MNAVLTNQCCWLGKTLPETVPAVKQEPHHACIKSAGMSGNGPVFLIFFFFYVAYTTPTRLFHR